MDNVRVWLQRGRCKRERELVETLVAEGHDPLQVAAIALKIARAEEKQRPVASVAVIPQEAPHPASERRDRFASREHFHSNRQPEGVGRLSHEPGMVRLSLRLGKSHGIRPNDIVGAIAYHADIPGSVIGKILIQEKRSLVDVPEQFVGKVLAADDAHIRRQPLGLKRE
jgi:ATP-dependent RNA helicase DeaD